MRTKRWPSILQSIVAKLLLASSAVFVSGPVWAISVMPPTIAEIEANNSFAQRHEVEPGTMFVSGSLSPTVDLSTQTPTYIEPRTLSPEHADFLTLDGLTAGEPFFAVLRAGGIVDTTLGSFDESGQLIGQNDDSGRFGIEGVDDALGGEVNADGSIRLGVTGCCAGFARGDPLNSAPHGVEGDYELAVYLGFRNIGDVDYFSFTGLEAGAGYELSVEDPIGTQRLDTVLGLFDDAGALLEFNDDVDFSGNKLSRLSFVADPTGEVNVALSGWPDTAAFVGEHAQIGDYRLELVRVSPAPVPLPPALGLLLLALAGIVARNHRA